jgi:hypothetical protein
VFRISFNSPFNWITNKLSPAITEKKEEVSHVLARKKRPRRARETCSTPPPLLLRPRNLPWPPLSFPGRTTPRFALASRFLHLFNADPPVTVSSTNTRPLTSRFPRGSLRTWATDCGHAHRLYYPSDEVQREAGEHQDPKHAEPRQDARCGVQGFEKLIACASFLFLKVYCRVSQPVP